MLLKNLLSEVTQKISSLGMQDDIELLVSNNNSDDNTDALVKSFLKDYNFIRYNKNDTNIGGKSNVLKSMELAKTPFVMFFGDDDNINVDGFKPVIDILKANNDVGVLLDTSISKFKYPDKLKRINAVELADKFYWYIGNAGCFIVQTNYIKENLSKYGYDFYNECWPQTQLMLIGLDENKKHKVYTGNFSLSKPSAHMDVMVYSSLYLWRTVVYDLRKSVDNIRHLISEKIYQSALNNMKKSAKQNFLNLLQCGVFIDDSETKKKTIDHIHQHLKMFSGKEKLLYWLVAFILSIPSFINKPLSNLFIYLTKGKKGINKKNDFVSNEFKKKRKNSSESSVRVLEFERE